MSAPKFDRDGQHWEGHGTPVHTEKAFGGEGPSVTTYSRRDERYYEGRAMVLVDVTALPFSFNACLLPAKARALAANLLLAAEHAEAVQALLDARAAKPKAVAP